MKTILALLICAIALRGQTNRTVILQVGASSTPLCTATVTTNCLAGYNFFRSTSTPSTTPLNSAPQQGLTYLDSTAVVGQTYTYTAVAFSVACANGVPPTGWTFCGSSAPVTATLTVPTAPGGIVSLTLIIP